MCQHRSRPAAIKIKHSEHCTQLYYQQQVDFLSIIFLYLPGNQRVLPADRAKFGAVLCQTLINNISHNAVDSLEGMSIPTCLTHHFVAQI